MIYLDGAPIKPTIFPDQTSQVWNVESLNNKITSRVTWEFDSEREFIHVAQLKTLLKHLENQFTKGMSWSNYGEWHIDHIIPLVSANNEKELYKLCHYTNLQPLWGSDNIKKGATLHSPKIETD